MYERYPAELISRVRKDTGQQAMDILMAYHKDATLLHELSGSKVVLYSLVDRRYKDNREIKWERVPSGHSINLANLSLLERFSGRDEAAHEEVTPLVDFTELKIKKRSNPYFNDLHEIRHTGEVGWGFDCKGQLSLCQTVVRVGHVWTTKMFVEGRELGDDAH